MMMWLFGTVLIAYALGSIPFGFMLAKASGIGDIRLLGSGNIGATNVARTGHKWLALATLLLDLAKGATAVMLCRYFYGDEFAAMGALFVILGHIFPVWLGFKGGKGVATALGVFFALNWMIGATVAVLWLVVFAVTRVSSISSLIAVGYSSIAAYAFDGYITALLCLCIAMLVIFTHRYNILRLLGGTESSFKMKAA